MSSEEHGLEVSDWSISSGTTSELDGSQIMWHLEGHIEDFEFYFDSNEQPLKELKCRSGTINFFPCVCMFYIGWWQE